MERAIANLLLLLLLLWLPPPLLEPIGPCAGSSRCDRSSMMSKNQFGGSASREPAAVTVKVAAGVFNEAVAP
jgi:hypothetical protein